MTNQVGYIIVIAQLGGQRFMAVVNKPHPRAMLSDSVPSTVI